MKPLHIRINHYSAAAHVDQVEVRPLGDAPAGECDWSGWHVAWQATEVVGRPDATAWHVRFTRTGAPLPSTAVGVDLAFDSWSVRHYVGMPAAVYAGNRFESRRFHYPPLLEASQDIGVGVPTIVGDIPRLNIQAGPSRLQQLATDMATPAVGIFDPDAARGVWLLTEHATSRGYSGFVLEESEDRRRATLTLLAPGVRADEHYWFMQMRDQSVDHPACFATGDRVDVRLRVYDFHCPDIPALYARFAEIRQDVEAHTEREDCLPYSAAWRLLEEKFNRENWSDALSFYRIGDGSNTYSEWQLGWVGGGMVTLAMLIAGTDVTRHRARASLDFIFTTQAESGFLHGIVFQGRYPGDGYGKPGTEHWLLLRKNADFLYFMGKQILLLERGGETVPRTWREGTQRLSEAFVRLWRRHQQFGQFVDVLTGAILVGGSTSAAIAPAGLALAARCFKHAEYLKVAVAAAQQYYDRDVCAGITTGGPGEILQAPDSESAFGLLEALVVLFEETGEGVWLDRARNMANICSSWVTSYDFPFPSSSLFGRLGMRATGSVWANAQNKHGAPGICTLAGDSLLKLFRATGEVKYLELLRDIAHALPQFVTRPDRPIGKQHSGWMTERVNISDWLEPVGEICEGSCWPECSLMLTWVEVPGVYAQPDTGLVCACDHVRAEWREGALRLTNSTSFPAQVRVLVESSAAAAQVPLAEARIEMVHVPAGATVVHHG